MIRMLRLASVPIHNWRSASLAYIILVANQHKRDDTIYEQKNIYKYM